MLKILKQGNTLVVRDEKDNLVRDMEGAVRRAVVRRGAGKETLRKAIARLTNDGHDLIMRLNALSQGIPQVATLPDGRMSEPVIPTPEVQLQATKDLIDRAYGKAVAQTEVLKAVREAEEVEQYQAMSDAELERIIEGDYKVLPNETDPEDGEP